MYSYTLGLLSIRQRAARPPLRVAACVTCQPSTPTNLVGNSRSKRAGPSSAGGEERKNGARTKCPQSGYSSDTVIASMRSLESIGDSLKSRGDTPHDRWLRLLRFL